MFSAVVEKEWAEVRRKGRGKVEDWTYVVTYSNDHYVLDVICVKTEADAKMNKALFELGLFKYGEYEHIVIDDVFEDMESVND